MQVVANMDPAIPLRDVGAYAARVESVGYDALHVPETIHDPFTVCTLALEHTRTITVRTSIALAFPRSPMVVAYAAWDLASFSGGRFELGLGTQIRANITDRYSAPYGDPVARMRDYLSALRAIFAAFATGEPLRFESEHYRFTRLQPYFNPGPLDGAQAPTLWLGGVNEKMCRLAGELADGFVTHPTNSNRAYLEDVCIPNIEKGAANAGRSAGDVKIVAGVPVVTGRTLDDMGAERERQRRSLAFTLSTPAYRRTLERGGWSDVGERLQQMTRDGAWDRLHEIVTDDVLEALVPHATYEQLPDVIAQWYGGLAHGVLIPPPRDERDDPAFRDAIAAIGR